MRFALVLALLAAPVRASVFIVRHAERADAKADKSLLSRKGKKRAELLSKVLGGVPLKAVYTTEYERTQQTAEPTAKAKGLIVTVTDSEKAADLAAELKLKPAETDVLVVGHTDTIPDILKGLGVAAEVKIPSDEYDNLFIVTPQKDAAPLFHRLKY
jgi:broad specificity phosphatase PhoE